MNLLVKLISILLPNSLISLGSTYFVTFVSSLSVHELVHEQYFLLGRARLLNKSKTKT